jgi:hypothetical protein
MSLLVACFDVPVRLDSLFLRIDAIDDRIECLRIVHIDHVTG